MENLGENKKKFVFVAQGTLPPRKMKKVMRQIIAVAGMTTARRARVDRYPYGGSWWRHLLYLIGFPVKLGGGIGFTVYQPLQESYEVADVYYDLSETEVLLSTCKPDRMNVAAVLQIMESEIGPSKEVIP